MSDRPRLSDIEAQFTQPCTCGYGGFHEPENPRCAHRIVEGAQEALTAAVRAVLDLCDTSARTTRPQVVYRGDVLAAVAAHIDIEEDK